MFENAVDKNGTIDNWRLAEASAKGTMLPPLGSGRYRHHSICSGLADKLGKALELIAPVRAG